MMNIMLQLHKRKDALIETGRVVRQFGMAEYVKVMIVKSITKEVTVQGDWRTYQLAWLVVRKIVDANLKGHKII